MRKNRIRFVHKKYCEKNKRKKLYYAIFKNRKLRKKRITFFTSLHTKTARLNKPSGFADFL